MDRQLRPSCSECEGLNRRQFVQAAATAAAVTALPTALPSAALAAPSRNSKAEMAIRELYSSLTDAQRQVLALPLDDERRTKISPNWSITKTKIGELTKPQQELVDRVVRNITSEDGYGRFIKQMKKDAGGIGRYSFAIFGDPEKDQFEFELTGRHLTMRADGNTKVGPAFGGPIVYGHSEPGNSPDNVFYYQTLRANAVFEMLDEKQRAKALLEKAPRETAIQLRKDAAKMPGIAGSDLSGDQQALVSAALKDILRPYREEDVQEAMKVVEAGGGVKALRMSFYSQGDLGDDKIWDNWRIEGPTIVCHFRGAPHVHAYINCAKKS